MQIAVDISYYPLEVKFIKPIEEFIERLKNRSDIEVKTNDLSTHIIGDYDTVMNLIRDEMKREFEDQRAVFVMRVVGRR